MHRNRRTSQKCTVVNTINTTQFHTYRLETTPGVGYELFVDNVSISAGALGTGYGLNRLLFGDGTSETTGFAEISSFTFSQEVPEPSTFVAGILGLMILTCRKIRWNLIRGRS